VPVPTAPSTHDPDAADVLRARAGDTAAFARLVRKHTRRAYVVAQTIVENHADADAVIQRAWARAWESLDQVDQSLAFAPWLWRLVASTARERKRHAPARAGGRAADDLVGQDERGDAVTAALSALSERRRQIVVFHDVHGIDHGDIATTLDLPVSTIRSELTLGRRQLHALLGNRPTDNDGMACAAGPGGEFLV